MQVQRCTCEDVSQADPYDLTAAGRTMASTRGLWSWTKRESTKVPYLRPHTVGSHCHATEQAVLRPVFASIAYHSLGLTTDTYAAAQHIKNTALSSRLSMSWGSRVAYEGTRCPLVALHDCQHGSHHSVGSDCTRGEVDADMSALYQHHGAGREGAHHLAHKVQVGRLQYTQGC